MSSSRWSSSAAILAASLSAAGLAAPAAAAVLTASSDYYENGVLVAGAANGDSPGAFASIYGDDGYGSAYSSSNGILNVSANTEEGGGAAAAMMMAFSMPAPSGAASVRSLATWEDTITNNTGQQIDYKYIFHVVNPRLGTSGNADDYAALSLDITVNGISVWSAFIEMDACDLSYSSSYSTISAPGTHVGCEASFASFDAAASLGQFAQGSSFTIGYEMIGYANAANADDTVYARIGDPAFVQGNPLQIIATPVSPTEVPEPAALALLGLGLAGLGCARRKRA